MEMVTDKDRIENLAANIRRVMLRNGFSQQKLADMSGVPQATIFRVLNAKNDPSVSLVSRLADALDTSIDKLLAEPPKKNLLHSS